MLPRSGRDAHSPARGFILPLKPLVAGADTGTRHRTTGSHSGSHQGHGDMAVAAPRVTHPPDAAAARPQGALHSFQLGKSLMCHSTEHPAPQTPSRA